MLTPVKETFSCILAHTLIFDRLDGHIARMTNTPNQFGVEFDSLAYIISFGIAPAMLLYIFQQKGLLSSYWDTHFMDLFVPCERSM